MGPHRNLRIYVGYKSPSIIKYLELITGDLFTARYANCIFNEDYFPTLGGDFQYHKECQEINWDATDISNSDPHTLETELQVQKIINLQHIANNTPDAFTNYKGITKSYNLAKNVPERIEVPKKTTQLPSKRGRSTTISKDAAPSKQRKKKNKSFNSSNATQPQVEEHAVEVQPSHPTSIVHSITDVGTSKCPDATILRDEDASQSVYEISINYLESEESYDQKTTIVDIYFSVMIAEILKNDLDLKTMAECKKHSD
jgi:hypothetical protein